MNSSTHLEYPSRLPPHSPRERSTFAVVGLAVGIVFNALAVVVWMDVLESLALQFYAYSVAFGVGAVLAVVGLLAKGRARGMALVALAVNLAGAAWKCGLLYRDMRVCSVKGWMAMPWPF